MASRRDRWARAAALTGLLVGEVAVARAYLGLGTWWHWLLHQLVGWGVGLSAAALVGAWTRHRVPPLAGLLTGQLVSITPDLLFRYARHPHTAAMDVYLGHISIHTGPSPVLVALASLLLGGWAWVVGAYGRRGPAAALAVGGLLLVLVACLGARDVPTRLQDYPLDTPRVVTGP